MGSICHFPICNLKSKWQEDQRANALSRFVSLEPHPPSSLISSIGCSAKIINVIIEDGFDIRVSNVNGAAGAGIYFGEVMRTSLSYIKVRISFDDFSLTIVIFN